MDVGSQWGCPLPGCSCGIVPWLLCPKSFDLNLMLFFFLLKIISM